MKSRSALIVAPPTANLRMLQEVLKRHGYKTVAPDMIAPGATWLDAWREAVRRADIVVGVVDGAALSPSVAFDLGVAAAHRDILVVAPPECELPVELASFYVVRAPVTNAEALSFFFENFEPRKLQQRRLARAKLRSIADRVNDYRQRATSSGGVELERLIADIFRMLASTLNPESASERARLTWQCGPTRLLHIWTTLSWSR